MIVRWTLEASADLEAVLSYIASRNPTAAAPVAERIERSVTSLAEFPRAGRRNPVSGALEWVVPGLPLLIIYTIPSAANREIGSRLGRPVDVTHAVCRPIRLSPPGRPTRTQCGRKSVRTIILSSIRLHARPIRPHR